MANRRTRKQKQKAKHKFFPYQQVEPKKIKSEPVVKGQKEKGPEAKFEAKKVGKTPKESANLGTLRLIRRDIFKSLLLASFVLGLEIVIYLAWTR